MKKFTKIIKVLLVVGLIALQVGVVVLTVRASDTGDTTLPTLMPDMEAGVADMAKKISMITGTIAVLLAVYLLGALLFSIGQLVEGSLEGNPMTINYARQALIASLIGEAAIGLMPLLVGLILNATAGPNGSIAKPWMQSTAP